MGIGKEIQARFLSNFFNVLTITIVFIFLILYYSANKGSYKEFTIMDIYKETINPNCSNKAPNLEDMLNTYGFYNKFCGGESIDDLNFVKYLLFIMFGSFIVCNEISNQVMINISQKIDNIGADGAQAGQNKKYNITAILLIFIFLDFFTTIIKEKFLAIYKIFDSSKPNAKNKKNMLTDVFSSFMSLLMTITVLIIMINCGIYLTYIAYGLFVSKSSPVSYLAILLGFPFLMAIAGVSLSGIEKFTNNTEGFDDDIEGFDDDIEEFDDDIEEFDDDIIEGFKEGQRNKRNKGGGGGSSGGGSSGGGSNKKKNKKKRKSVRKAASKFVKCNDYNYIWYILGFFIIPIFVSIYIICNLFFNGLIKLFTISDPTNISKLKHLLIISLILSAAIFCWILFEKLLNIYGIYLPKL